MRQKAIEANLKKAFLEDGPFAQALFEFDLQDQIESYQRSKTEDHDEYLFVVTENNNDVAMFLIDQKDKVHINEAARAVLKALWKNYYAQNLRRFIPDMAHELDEGNLYEVGVKTPA